MDDENTRRLMRNLIDFRIIMRQTTGNAKKRDHSLFILFELSQEGQKKSVRVKDLSDRLGVTPAAASQMLDIQVRKGNVERFVDIHDRRVVNYSLTERGQKKLQTSMKEITQFIHALLEYFGPEKARDFVDLTHEMLMFCADYYKEEKNEGMCK